MYRVLIVASFAVAVQAQSAAPTPDVTTASPFSAAQIQQHTLMGWNLPLPGPGARPPRTVQPQTDTTTAPPALSPAQIQHHMLMGWALPEAGAGARIARAVPSPLSDAQPQRHIRREWTFLDAGGDPRQTRALPPPSGVAGTRIFRGAPRAPPAHRAHGPRSQLLPTHYSGGAIRAPLH